MTTTSFNVKANRNLCVDLITHSFTYLHKTREIFVHSDPKVAHKAGSCGIVSKILYDITPKYDTAAWPRHVL